MLDVQKTYSVLDIFAYIFSCDYLLSEQLVPCLSALCILRANENL